MKKSFFITIFFILILMVSGCASSFKNYARVEIVPKKKGAMTIQNLVDQWDKYHIYYAGRDDRFPLGIIFDPKDNDTSLTGDRWKNIESKKNLLAIMGRIEPTTSYYPSLSEIIGPDGRLYGYLYHSFGPAVFKRIDDNKMYAFNLEDPNDRDGRDEMTPIK
jgi:hypothetical protein